MASETGQTLEPSGDSQILKKAALVKELVNDLEFQKYLKSQFATESLDFYKEATAFEDNAATMSDEQRAAEAQKILSKFIDLGSPFQINVDSAVRLATKEKVKNGAPPGTFTVPIDTIITLLAVSLYPEYQQSPMYKPPSPAPQEPAAPSTPSSSKKPTLMKRLFGKK